MFDKNIKFKRVSKNETGQAIVFILFMLPVLCVAALLTYNTAKVAAEKMRLQNSVDAATYSAMVVAARNLNYISYTNRAMASNEASVAMLASMQTSWAAMITTAANMKQASALMYILKSKADFSRLNVVGGFKNIGKARRASSQADKWADKHDVLQKPLGFIVDFLRALNAAISASQWLHYGATLTSVPYTAALVMSQNDPDAQPPATETALLATTFATQYAMYIRPYHMRLPGGTEEEKFKQSQRFAYVAAQSRDDWTRQRRLLPLHIANVVDLGATSTLSPQAAAQMGLAEKLVQFLLPYTLNWRGGTELVAERSSHDRYGRRIRWQSADTVYSVAPLQFLFTDFSFLVNRSTDTLDLVDVFNFDPNGDTQVAGFGWGAGVAAQGKSDEKDSWSGAQLTMENQLPGARVYGNAVQRTGETESQLRRSAIDRAIDGADRQILMADPFSLVVALIAQAKWRYGNHQEIGLKTNGWYMPSYFDVRTYEQMTQTKEEDWWADVKTGLNPLKFGTFSDNGPTLSLVFEKKDSSVKTAEQLGIGYTDRATDSERPGRIGLPDYQKRPSGSSLVNIGNSSASSNYKVRVLSSAQVYFKRPQDRWVRRDVSPTDPPKFGFTGGYIEHRNLFSPYWQVRNVQPSLWAQAIAVLSRPINSLSSDMDGVTLPVDGFGPTPAVDVTSLN